MGLCAGSSRCSGLKAALPHIREVASGRLGRRQVGEGQAGREHDLLATLAQARTC
ncbi:MAG: hypothetical protein ACYCO3_02510 [Mycobacteriales bacterium]